MKKRSSSQMASFVFLPQTALTCAEIGMGYLFIHTYVKLLSCK